MTSQFLNYFPNMIFLSLDQFQSFSSSLLRILFIKRLIMKIFSKPEKKKHAFAETL